MGEVRCPDCEKQMELYDVVGEHHVEIYKCLFCGKTFSFRRDQMGCEYADKQLERQMWAESMDVEIEFEEAPILCGKNEGCRECPYFYEGEPRVKYERQGEKITQ